MAKEMVYFNATKQIETITIHYNSKLDGAFVDDVAKNIKEVAKKMSKVDLKNPKEFYSVQVFVYASQKMFNKIFSGEIEKRFYSRRRSLEDLYVVRDSDGNIHILSPRGKGTEKAEAFKKILVMKVLGEYMDEKERQTAERLLKEAMKPKVQEEQEPEEEIEEVEPDEPEEIEQDEELDEEELDEMIETELIIEQIDEQDNDLTYDEDGQEGETKKVDHKDEARQWLHVGWLAFVNGRLKKAKDIKRFANNISKKGVKKLGQLSDTKLFENYNYSQEYACALVEYIVETYGMQKFTEFYENPKDIEGVFGTTKFRFNNDVKAFVYRKYSDKEMKMDIDEKGLDEITKVHFAKGGGADIISDKEIEAPEIKVKE